MARKPLVGTVAANVLQHGTGALNIDGCRVVGGDDTARPAGLMTSKGHAGGSFASQSVGPRPIVMTSGGSDLGRWPANIIHDGSEEVLAAFPQAPGQIADISTKAPSAKTAGIYGPMKREGELSQDNRYGDEGIGFQMKPGARRLDAGSAARFFYTAKASAFDRHDGLPPPGHQFRMGSTPRDAEKVNAAGRGNHHPTVKPTDLMRYLVRLVTPPGGTVLDPFMGSGSTLKAAELEGFSAIGIELDPAYIEIARRRIASDAPLFAEVA